MSTRSWMRSLVLGGLVAALGLTQAATPPARFNYQGVLRDANGQPLDGSFDMRFHLFDAAAGGNEIVVDRHLAAGMGAVVVQGGVFNVAVGSGDVADGSASLPGDPYLDVHSAARDFAELYLEVEIDPGTGFETLSPRIRIDAAPFAMNSTHLEGKRAAEFIDTSAVDQTKVGNLTIGDVTLSSTALYFAPTGSFVTSTGGSGTQLYSGAGQPLQLVAGATATDGQLRMSPGQEMQLDAGNGWFEFRRGSDSASVASLTPTGLTAGAFYPGSQNVHGLTWNTPESRFQFSEDVYTSGNVQADGEIQGGFVSSTPRGYHALVSTETTPASNAMGNHGDLLVRWDLEVGARLNIANRNTGGGLGGWMERIDGSLDEFRIQSAGGTGTDDVLMNLRSTNGMWFTADLDGDQPITAFQWFTNGTDFSDRVLFVNSYGDMYLGGSLTENFGFDLAESFFAAEPVSAGDVVALAPGTRRAVRKSQGPDDATVLGVVSAEPGIVMGGSAFSVEQLRKNWGDAIVALFEERKAQFRAKALTTDQDLSRRHGNARSIDPSSLPEKDENGGTPRADYEASLKQLESELEAAALHEFYQAHFVPIAIAGRVPVEVDASAGAIEPGDLLAPGPTPGVAVKATRAGVVIGTALEPLTAGRGQVLTWVNRSHYTPATPGGSTADAVTAALSPTSPRGAVDILVSPRGDTAPLTIARQQDTETGLERELLRVDREGTVKAGAYRSRGTAVAESMQPVQPVTLGDVVRIARDGSGVERTTDAADHAVVGIVTDGAGLVLGEDESKSAAIAMTGIVECNVDAGYGAIRPGDLLTSSPTAGHAMRADEARPGTLIAKALETLETGTGRIRVVVMLR